NDIVHKDTGSALPFADVDGMGSFFPTQATGGHLNSYVDIVRAEGFQDVALGTGFSGLLDDVFRGKGRDVDMDFAMAGEFVGYFNAAFAAFELDIDQVEIGLVGGQYAHDIFIAGRDAGDMVPQFGDNVFQ